MTDEQIIKAVEICRTSGTCRGCPYHELYTAECICALMKDVFDLIDRKKSDIEREINQIKSEAIKEFVERLKRTSIGLEIGDDKKFKMTVVSTVAIDNLVKEMTEVQK